MRECTKDELGEIYSSVLDEAADAGFILPVTSFSYEYVDTLQAALIEHQVTSCKDELDQFIQGKSLELIFFKR